MGVTFSLESLTYLLVPPMETGAEEESPAWLAKRQRRWNALVREIHRQTGNYPFPIPDKDHREAESMSYGTYASFAHYIATETYRTHCQDNGLAFEEDQESEKFMRNAHDCAAKYYPHLLCFDDEYSAAVPWDFPVPFRWSIRGMMIVSLPRLFRELEAIRKKFKVRSWYHYGTMEEGADVLMDLHRLARKGLEYRCILDAG